MHTFGYQQKIKVIDKDSPLYGKTGTVARIRTDGAAWVNMDDELPEGMSRFPSNDNRARQVQLEPEQCATAGK